MCKERAAEDNELECFARPLPGEQPMLWYNQRKLAMKTSHSSPKRRARRSPWSGQNMRLLRAALKVWELKQRDRFKVV